MNHSTHSRTGDSAPMARASVHDRSQKTRADIVLIAAARFDLLGYHASSINVIVKGSKFTKGAIYYHFSTKEDIAWQLVSDCNENFDYIVSTVKNSGLSAAQQIVAIFHILARWIAGNTNFRAGVRLMAEPSFDEGFQFTSWVATIERLIDNAMASGEFREDPAVRRLAWNLCIGIVGILRSSVVMEEGDTILTRIDDLIFAYLGNAADSLRHVSMLPEETKPADQILLLGSCRTASTGGSR